MKKSKRFLVLFIILLFTPSLVMASLVSSLTGKALMLPKTSTTQQTQSTQTAQQSQTTQQTAQQSTQSSIDALIESINKLISDMKERVRTLQSKEVVKKANGEQCSSNEECQSGLCKTMTVLTLSKVCAACTSNTDCGTGKACSNGVCVAAQISIAKGVRTTSIIPLPTLKPSGADCTSDNECLSNYCLNNKCTSRLR